MNLSIESKKELYKILNNTVLKENGELDSLRKNLKWMKNIIIMDAEEYKSDKYLDNTSQISKVLKAIGQELTSINVTNGTISNFIRNIRKRL